ncbi:uncharacterized protein BDFB_006597 [Asbolus verrucosus]|uniref:MADF domain-containing protein n=1 Tax=Asbolus verrucosus TaxID=1661398 RepID=A0A482VFT4_ASBVE|nr:uncharacterized protein BDFB_006597 [Asbolus verrucosus]
MDRSVYVLSEHEVFMREFIALYKQHPVLWQQKHPQYRNRSERTEAYEVLVKKCQQYYPEADEDFVRMKIDSMRSTFRKERRKVLNSKENSKNPEDVYKPSLWYYELLLFTAGEEAENESNTNSGTEKDEMSTVCNNPEDGNLVKIPFWSREHSALLISFYKNYPSLYSTSHPQYRNKRKRNEAVKKITDKLMAVTGKYFHSEDRRKSRRKNSSSEESDDDLEIKKESDSSLSSESAQLEEKQSVVDDDIYDTIAKNVAHKLRDMTKEQRTIAEKIVKDVMYHGQMENLTVHSRLSLDGS